MEEKHAVRRKWVKRIAIVFFITILLLTFFSNTIMNYSLAQVSTQSIESDSVATKIRGTGTVEAADSKEISISESREVESVLVKADDEVKTGDVLVKLAAGENSEIVEAEKALQDLKDAYYNSILVGEIDQAIVNKAENGGDSYETKRATLTSLSNNTKAAQEKVNNIQAEIDKINQAAGDAGSDNLDEDGSAGVNPQLDSLSKNLEAAQKELDAATKAHDDYLAQINTINELIAQNEAIKEAQTNLDKMKQKTVSNEVKAPVDGKIVSVDIKAGDTTTPDMAFITMQGSANGYTLSFSVTKEQSKKVKVGDEASIADAWYYDDVTVTLSSIKNDPEMPGKQKLLVFDVKGDVEVGTTMSLSIGDKSSTYDYVVPNSAVREDNNGKFILIVKEKNSPLGNRYVASRVEVEVTVSDDSKTAITGAVEGGEYVITTSSKMINPGDLVRLAD